jgi:hypothetical protein
MHTKEVVRLTAIPGGMPQDEDEEHFVSLCRDWYREGRYEQGGFGRLHVEMAEGGNVLQIEKTFKTRVKLKGAKSSVA